MSRLVLDVWKLICSSSKRLKLDSKTWPERTGRLGSNGRKPSGSMDKRPLLTYYFPTWPAKCCCRPMMRSPGRCASGVWLVGKFYAKVIVVFRFGVRANCAASFNR